MSRCPRSTRYRTAERAPPTWSARTERNRGEAHWTALTATTGTGAPMAPMASARPATGAATTTASAASPRKRSIAPARDAAE